MGSTFKATLIALLRTPAALIWTLAFPVLMATLFVFMFSSMRSDGSIDAVPVAVVADEAWGASPFAQVVDALAGAEGAGDGSASDGSAAADPDDGFALLSVARADDRQQAEELFESGEVDGVFSVDASGEVSLTVASESSAAHQRDRGGAYGVNRSILESIASSYAQSRALIERIAEEDPASLSDPAAVARALSLSADSERISPTRGTPDDTIRYYYALLGMAVMFTAQLSMIAVASLQPTVSMTAARRCVAGVSRIRQLAGALLASWLLASAFLTAAFFYIRFAAGIDFQGREGLCLLGVAAGSCLASGLGALIASLPLRGGVSTGSGILTGLTCVLSVFAGLYGKPVMELADSIARAVPLSTWVNPVRLVCDLFYSLYYYESLAPFATRLLACLAFGALLFGLAAPLFRRQRHAHL